MQHVNHEKKQLETNFSEPNKCQYTTFKIWKLHITSASLREHTCMNKWFKLYAHCS